MHNNEAKEVLESWDGFGNSKMCFVDGDSIWIEYRLLFLLQILSTDQCPPPLSNFMKTLISKKEIEVMGMTVQVEEDIPEKMRMKLKFTNKNFKRNQEGRMEFKNEM